jgi:two-component system, chemotaxis family, sensor kinase Cph1
MSIGPFGNCKSADLHLIQEIQGYGGMIVIDKRSHLITAASDNIVQFLGQSTEELLGQPWTTCLQPDWINTMFLADELEAINCFIRTAEVNGQSLEISNHTQENFCVVELELSKTGKSTLDFVQRSAFIKQLSKTSTPEESASLLMEKISTIIQFDRVLLYKFLPDWHGEVINEKLKPGIEGFLGLRFPEGDVPANARRLFTINLQRLIADVNQKNAKLVALNPDIEVDMSFAQLRAIHPVHIKYLQNLGVPASFSVSIVAEGKLWGMLACHHLSPKVLSITERQSCEELARITAMHMSDTIRGELEKGRYHYRVAISEIRGALNTQVNGKLAITSLINKMKQLFNADGVWQYLEGDDFFSGMVPDPSHLTIFKNWLAKLDRNKVTIREKIEPELANFKPSIR